MSTPLTAAAILLEQQAAALPAVSNKMAIQAAIEIVKDLTLTTPVDTGTAVSNWQVTLNEPASDIIPAYAPSPKGKTIKGQWEHAVDPGITRQANASQVIDKAVSVINLKQPEQDIYIVNNLNYISILNQGSSDQAPAGFTERAQIIAQSVLSKV